MRRLALIALIVLGVLGACDGGSSALDAAPGAITLSAGPTSAPVTGFRWGANNDCGAASVTIQGAAAGGGGIGLCLPRADLIGAGAIDLADDTKVQLVGATLVTSACTTAPAPGARPSGTVTFTGFSTQTGASYQLTLAGQVAGRTSCADAGSADVTIGLAGTALVTPR
jgi:hypothetical protein